MASNSFSSEREEDTWISLIASPLTAVELIRGKIVGAFWAMQWVLGLWLVVAFLGLLVGSLHPFGFVAGLAFLVVYLNFIAALGTWFSLPARGLHPAPCFPRWERCLS